MTQWMWIIFLCNLLLYHKLECNFGKNKLNFFILIDWSLEGWLYNPIFKFPNRKYRFILFYLLAYHNTFTEHYSPSGIMKYLYQCNPTLHPLDFLPPHDPLDYNALQPKWQINQDISTSLLSFLSPIVILQLPKLGWLWYFPKNVMEFILWPPTTVLSKWRKICTHRLTTYAKWWAS